MDELPIAASASASSTSVIYKRAIVGAISDLQDHNLRSNVDSVRRRVQASLDKVDTGKGGRTDANNNYQQHHPQHSTPWNETIFLKSLKSLVQDGDVEQCTSLNCGLSPEFKRKVKTKALFLAVQHQQQQQQLQQQQGVSPGTTNYEPSIPILTGGQVHRSHHVGLDEKDAPVRKTEHFKLKIVPKKIYDIQQYVF